MMALRHSRNVNVEAALQRILFGYQPTMQHVKLAYRNLYKRKVMKKPIRYAVVVAALLTTIAGSFALGAKSARMNIEQLNVQIAAGQAMLWFNHLKRFQELEEDLANGCSATAHEKVKVSIALEMDLLSSFYREHNDTWVNEYISKRDPELIKQLASYKNPYGTSWKEPKCPR